jgi:Zn-dependent protease with chaperone function
MMRFFAAGLVFALFQLSGCVEIATSPSPRPSRDSSDSSSSRRVDSRDADRLRRVIVPLVRAMDHPCKIDEIRVGIIDQNEINAANAGSCEFYVTMGLLRRANDDQLRGVMAHEIAHQDLGHVAKAQVLGAGLNIGAALLQQIFPGSGAIAPLAGTLIARSYGRSEEYAADQHGIDILRRAGHSPEIMVDTLSWIRRQSGAGGGGFLSTHPALDERIAALKRLR